MRNRMLRSGVAAAALVLIAGSTAALGQVAFRTGGDEQRPVMTPMQLSQAMIGLSARADASRVVVQFDRPVLDAERDQLVEAGVVLLRYLGDNAYFARLDPGVRPMRAIQAAPMSSMRAIRPEWKLHPMIARDEIAHWTIVDEDERANPTVAIYAVLHRDVAPADGAALIAAHGGEVVSSIRTINGLVVHMPHDRVAGLADLDEVQWIEPANPIFDTVNNSNRIITQVDQVQSAPYDLDGTGVTAFVYDAGSARLTHLDLVGRTTRIDTTGVSTHATHVSATVGGSGAARGDRLYRGMAPNATLLSAGFEQEGGLRQGFLYTDPGDIEEDYGVAIGLGASVANNSIGTNTASNGFPCEWTGDYCVTDTVIDEVARGSLGGPIIIVWANGNERQTARCGNLYHTTAPPATAKNHITVGALNSNNDTMTSFSSWGPVDDGRMKPDVSAPGCQSNDDNGVTSATGGNNSGYTTLCGTSMACPTVTGIVTLMLQDFRAQFPGLPDPLGSTVKVILAHTAHDLGNPGPDNQFGYGSVRAKDAIDFMRMAQFTEQPISTGSVHTYEVVIAPGTGELKYTLAWADPAGTPNTIPALVNNLDVRAIDPMGNVHYPWTLNYNDPGAPATRDKPNNVDNIEQVYVENPMPGVWTIEVAGTSVPEGPQIYSLAGSPDLNVTLVSINLSSILPPLVSPGESLAVEATVTIINDVLVPDSAMLHYRFDENVAFTTIPLDDLGGSVFAGLIPGTGCSSEPQFFFSVEGVGSGVVYGPGGGALTPHTYAIGDEVIAIHDDFETDMGWFAENLGATTGDWERGVPVNDPNWPYAPITDGDGSGQCLLTENAPGNTDVDDGAVRITSPLIDMSGDGAEIEYLYYLRLTDSNSTDHLLVEISSNDLAGPWTLIADHNTDRGRDWVKHVISNQSLADLGVSLTSTMRVRFTANDDDPQSIVEAGIDGFIVRLVSCEDDSCPADLNGDGQVDAADFFMYLDWFADGDARADLNGDGELDATDFFMYLDLFAQGCD